MTSFVFGQRATLAGAEPHDVAGRGLARCTACTVSGYHPTGTGGHGSCGSGRTGSEVMYFFLTHVSRMAIQKWKATHKWRWAEDRREPEDRTLSTSRPALIIEWSSPTGSFQLFSAWGPVVSLGGRDPQYRVWLIYLPKFLAG